MVRIIAAALLGSAAAFSPRAAPMATRTVVFAGEDYASMDGPALAAAIDGKRKELFDMRLENRQGRQKTTFKSNVVRNLKKDIARMMPFLEAKQACQRVRNPCATAFSRITTQELQETILRQLAVPPPRHA